MKCNTSKRIMQNTVRPLSLSEVKLSPVRSPDWPSLPREPVCPLTFSSFHSDPRDFSPSASQRCQSACSFDQCRPQERGMPWRGPRAGWAALQGGERSGESLGDWAWAEGGREQGAGQTLEWGCRKQVVGRVDDEPVSLTLALWAGTLAGARLWRRTPTELWLGFHGWETGRPNRWETGKSGKRTCRGTRPAPWERELLPGGLAHALWESWLCCLTRGPLGGQAPVIWKLPGGSVGLWVTSQVPALDSTNTSS